MGLGTQAQLARNICGVPDTGLTATGSSSQANSYAITADVSVFTTAAGNSGARLPAGVNPGDSFVITNGDSNTMLIYPPVGYKVNFGSTNAAASLTTLKSALCISYDGNNYIAIISG